jgi:NodT family efflux transporter outer membrane factor (OMF) lipoprotein
MRKEGRAIAGACALACVLALAGCSVGPKYQRPSVQAPGAFKEQPPPGWKNAAPSDAIAKGDWWQIFGDAALSGLETQAVKENQTVKAALSRVEQARAAARVTRADLFPTVSGNPSVGRARESGNRPLPPGTPPTAFAANDILLPLDLSYELDLWGRVRRSVESARATAEASAADYENALLLLEAEVAQDYFYLRYVDADRAILRDNIQLLERALALVRVRHDGGVASGLDVSEAETLLATTEADYAGLARQRAQYEHALALLLGKPPADFALPEAPITAEPPPIPPGLPSDLLERRPDIAEAERRMVAQNAQIGVARAAYFPQLSLTGSAGYESTGLASLFSLPSAMWSVAAALTAPMYEAGRLKANVEVARAAYAESEANYRQQVLVAFQEVEDSLSDSRVLEEQEIAQERAVESAERTAAISTARYREGLANYLEVIDAERTVLQNQQLVAQIHEQRLAASVQLIKALGGGWQARKIP